MSGAQEFNHVDRKRLVFGCLVVRLRHHHRAVCGNLPAYVIKFSRVDPCHHKFNEFELLMVNRVRGVFDVRLFNRAEMVGSVFTVLIPLSGIRSNGEASGNAWVH
jgi:hypothetical protein